MKRKRAALYDPYLDVMGGGEKHILSVMKVLEEEGYDVSVFWKENVADKISTQLGLSFQQLSFISDVIPHSSVLSKIRALRDFDVFIYVTDGSYFFSNAAKNIVFFMYPDRKIYPLGMINKIKTYNYTYICNSQFTQKHLLASGIEAEVLYPYIDQLVISPTPVRKDKIILSVGRFFPQLHSKRQDKIIEWFKVLKQKNQMYEDFKLILAGGLKDEDKEYFITLQRLAHDDTNIIFRTNISTKEIVELYQKSIVYWHFAGIGVDEELYPEMVEHLGITPLEAMAEKSIVFCYRAGGPKEIIQDGENGFLFSSQEELFEKMDSVLQNTNLQEKIMEKASSYVEKVFNYEHFKQNVMKIINNKS
ncbi:MAG: glycosyltransferase family 4 protein [bacterium]|nr:glycosyltransferase family 4 protein [bacterium]